MSAACLLKMSSLQICCSSEYFNTFYILYLLISVTLYVDESKKKCLQKCESHFPFIGRVNVQLNLKGSDDAPHQATHGYLGSDAVS